MVRVFDKSCVVVGEVEVPLVSPDERWHCWQGYGSRKPRISKQTT